MSQIADEAEATSLQMEEFLQSNRLLVVDRRSQRPYVWGMKHLSHLWMDLVRSSTLLKDTHHCTMMRMRMKQHQHQHQQHVADSPPPHAAAAPLLDVSQQHMHRHEHDGGYKHLFGSFTMSRCRGEEGTLQRLLTGSSAADDDDDDEQGNICVRTTGGGTCVAEVDGARELHIMWLGDGQQRLASVLLLLRCIMEAAAAEAAAGDRQGSGSGSSGSGGRRRGKHMLKERERRELDGVVRRLRGLIVRAERMEADDSGDDDDGCSSGGRRRWFRPVLFLTLDPLMQPVFLRLMTQDGTIEAKRGGGGSGSGSSNDDGDDDDGVEMVTFGHRALNDAKRFFADKIRAMREALGGGSAPVSFPKWLQALYYTVLRLQMQTFVSWKGLNRWTLFEAQNNRGRPLSGLDKLRALLLCMDTEFNLDRSKAILSLLRHVMEKLFEYRLDKDSAEDRLLGDVWTVFSGFEGVSTIVDRIYKDMDIERRSSAVRMSAYDSLESVFHSVFAREEVRNMLDNLLLLFHHGLAVHLLLYRNEEKPSRNSEARSSEELESKEKRILTQGNTDVRRQLMDAYERIVDIHGFYRMSAFMPFIIAAQYAEWKKACLPLESSDILQMPVDALDPNFDQKLKVQNEAMTKVLRFVERCGMRFYCRQNRGTGLGSAELKRKAHSVVSRKLTVPRAMSDFLKSFVNVKAPEHEFKRFFRLDNLASANDGDGFKFEEKFIKFVLIQYERHLNPNHSASRSDHHNIWCLLPYDVRQHGTEVDLPQDMISGFNNQPKLYRNVFSQYVLVDSRTKKDMEAYQDWEEFVQILGNDTHIQANQVARVHSQTWNIQEMNRRLDTLIDFVSNRWSLDADWESDKEEETSDNYDMMDEEEETSDDDDDDDDDMMDEEEEMDESEDDVVSESE